jgi:ABC-type branched-subunit amino acid transport system substrate-binding protein
MLGFEAVWITALAMTEAGTSDDVAKIARALRSKTWQTPRGAVTFDAAGQASGGGLIPLGVVDGKLLPSK